MAARRTEGKQAEKLLKGCSHIYPEQTAKTPPCSERCPAGTDVRGWIAYIAQRKKLGLSLSEAYTKAWEHLVAYNPLPASLGRVCPHPCEDGCNRQDVDEEVGVNSMERFIGDWAIEEGLRLPFLEKDRSGNRVAVIGSGPSGLSFAYQMARRGYAVTIFEKQSQPGGMLRYGIPSYRLPKDVLEAEIQRIVDLGVELRLGAPVGQSISIERLREEYELVFLGIGAQKSRMLGVPGEEGPGVWTGTEYLYNVNCGFKVDLGSQVVVIGGGNTAIDAARAARRSGASVTLAYRRSRQEMPAIRSEIEHALLEEVTMEFLVAPIEILRKDGVLTGIRAERMQLAEPDESGRRRPVPIPNSEFKIPATAVITAISQLPDWEMIEDFNPAGGWLQADSEGQIGTGVWTGGDVLSPGIASLAVGHGRRAAEAAHAKLQGLPNEQVEGPKANMVRSDYYSEKPKSSRNHRPVERWLAEPVEEVDQGITEHQFLQEVSRCLSCGSCFGCGHCQMYCNSAAYTPLLEPKPGIYFSLALDQCEGCGKCIEICPCGFLGVKSS